MKSLQVDRLARLTYEGVSIFIGKFIFIAQAIAIMM